MTLILDASDRVVLDTSTLIDGSLVDLLTSERHGLNDEAATLLARCDGARTVGAIAAEGAAAWGVEPAAVLDDLAVFIEPLLAAGLVRVRRRWWRRAFGVVLDRGGDPQPLLGVARRRFPPSGGGVALATLRAGRLVLGCAVLASLASVGALAYLAPGVTLGLGLVPLLVALSALATVGGHEAAHLLAVPRVGGHPLCLGAATNRVAVVHDVTEPRRRAVVAVAGPVGGAAVALAAGPLLGTLPTPADDLAGGTAVLLAAGHLAGLLPWFADGRHLWAAFR